MSEGNVGTVRTTTQHKVRCTRKQGRYVRTHPVCSVIMGPSHAYSRGEQARRALYTKQQTMRNYKVYQGMYLRSRLARVPALRLRTKASHVPARTAAQPALGRQSNASSPVPLGATTLGHMYHHSGDRNNKGVHHCGFSSIVNIHLHMQ